MSEKLKHEVGRCARCGKNNVVVHGRRVGGGPQTPTCNGCTRKRRAEKPKLPARA